MRIGSYQFPPREEVLSACETLGRGMFRPSSSGRQAAIDAAASTRRVDEVWERFSVRDIIPTEWVNDGRRLFAREPAPSNFFRDDDRSRPSSPSIELRDFPTCVEAAVTIASDVAGVLRAERSAQEWYWRWSTMRRMPQFAGVIWRVLPRHSSLIWMDYDERELRLADACKRGMHAVYAKEGSLEDYRDSDVVNDATAYGLKCGAAFASSSSKASGAWLSMSPELREVQKHMRTSIVRTLIISEACREGATIAADETLDLVADGARICNYENPIAPKLDVCLGGYIPQGFRLGRPYTVGGSAERRGAGEGWVVLIALAGNPASMPHSTVSR